MIVRRAAGRHLQDGEHLYVVRCGEYEEIVYADSPEQAEVETKSSSGLRLKCGLEGATNAARFLAAPSGVLGQTPVF
jgi:hypothetical protein